MSPGISATYGVRTFASLLIRRYKASSKTTASTPDYEHMSGGMRLSKFGYETSTTMHHGLSISSGEATKRGESKMCISSHKVEGVVKEVEEVAEVVEKVATATEKLSREVAEKLDNGEVKEVALMVEHVSNVIAKDAQMTEDFIHKVGDLKQDLTNLEAMISCEA
ncbi:hypothetical protein R6Q57_029487 [Mikania cordata]